MVIFMYVIQLLAKLITNVETTNDPPFLSFVFVLIIISIRDADQWKAMRLIIINVPVVHCRPRPFLTLTRVRLRHQS